MTIHNIKAYLASLWDWACLDGCFGRTRIRVTDIDGTVERKGRFLYLEPKLPGVAIPEGQMLYFKQRVQDGVSTVIFVSGRPGQPDSMRIMTKENDTKVHCQSIDDLRAVVAQWYKSADQGEVT